MPDLPMAERPVVFDLDGTLVDSRGDIAAACNYTLARAGRAALPVDVISSFVGDGARQLVDRAFGEECRGAELDAHVTVFLDYYTAHPVQHSRLLPFAEHALTALTGRKLAVCTNKARQTALPVLDALGLSRHFSVVVAGGDCSAPKPAKEMLELVAQRLGVTASSLVMVGDGPQDVLAARAVGAVAIGVKGGLLPLTQLVAAGPDALLDGLDELPGLLVRMAL